MKVSIKLLSSTSSTIAQLSIGDALAISTMNFRKFGKLDFKKFHPSGSLGAKLKTVEDLMIKEKKVPFIKENVFLISALNTMNKFNLGVLVVRNNLQKTSGIISDGDIKRISEKNTNINCPTRCYLLTCSKDKCPPS